MHLKLEKHHKDSWSNGYQLHQHCLQNFPFLIASLNWYYMSYQLWSAIWYGLLHSDNCYLNKFHFFCLPDLGSSFWGMALILASTHIMTARIAAGCLALALLVVLFVAKNVRWLSMQTVPSCICYAIHKIYCCFFLFLLFSLNGPRNVLISVPLLVIAMPQPVDTSRTLYWWVLWWSCI